MLKPVAPDRFERSLERAKEQITRRSEREPRFARAVPQSPGTEPSRTFAKRLVVSKSGLSS